MKQAQKILLPSLLAFMLVMAIAFSFNSLDSQQQDVQLMRLNSFAPVPVSRQKNDRTINILEEKLHRHGESPKLLLRLGTAYLQQVRETGDFSYYAKAEKAFAKLLENPGAMRASAMAGMAEVCLGRHDFAKARQWAQKAQQLLPNRAMIYGILSDAEIELGLYERAVATIQKMVDLRPDIGAYSRVSYVRELYGDIEDAISAMKMAVQADVPGEAGTEWCRVQLASLYLNQGDVAMAEAGFQQALYYLPGNAYALAGLAQTRVAQKRYDEAIVLYEAAIAAAKIPDFWAGLGEVYELIGKSRAAAQKYDLAWKFLESERANGIDPDLELAMLGIKIEKNPQDVLELAKSAYAKRPTVFAADVLAWAYYLNGEYESARKYMQRALRLGTKDAMMHYHAGMIACRLGQRAEAERHLDNALAINPDFPTVKTELSCHPQSLPSK